MLAIKGLPPQLWMVPLMVLVIGLALFAFGLSAGATAFVEALAERRRRETGRDAAFACAAGAVALVALILACLDVLYVGTSLDRRSLTGGVREVVRVVEQVLEDGPALLGVLAVFSAYAAPYVPISFLRIARARVPRTATSFVLSAILIAPCLAALSASDPYLRGREWGLLISSLALTAALLTLGARPRRRRRSAARRVARRAGGAGLSRARLLRSPSASGRLLRPLRRARWQNPCHGRRP